MKHLRPSSKFKNVKNSYTKLSNKVHPTRYLKEDNILPGLTAKQKLFVTDDSEKQYHPPGAYFALTSLDSVMNIREYNLNIY